MIFNKTSGEFWNYNSLEIKTNIGKPPKITRVNFLTQGLRYLQQ